MTVDELLRFSGFRVLRDRHGVYYVWVCPVCGHPFAGLTAKSIAYTARAHLARHFAFKREVG